MNGTAFMMSETVGLAAEDWMSETVGWMIGDLTSVPRELTAVSRLFDVKGPFRYFYVELAMKHPYWGSIRWPLAAPEFDRYYPSVNTYLQEYEDKGGSASYTGGQSDPDGKPGGKKEIQMSAAGSAGAAAAQPVKSVLGNKKPAAATGTSAVEEIKKYKELLDAGVITQEEFSAKKSS